MFSCSFQLKLPTTLPLNAANYDNLTHELYKIWGFHGSDYGDPGLLGHDAVWFGEWVPLNKPHSITSQKT